MFMAGLIFIGALTHFDVKGAILMGVVSVSVVVWGYPPGPQTPNSNLLFL